MEPHLPVELQLHVLELASPPLTSTNFGSRRDLCKSLSLVHSAWTGTAQAALNSVVELNIKDEELERAHLERILQGVEEKDVRVDGVVLKEAFVWTPEGHPLWSNKPLLRVLRGITQLVLDNSAEEEHFPFPDEAFPNLRSLSVTSINGNAPIISPSTLTRLHLSGLNLFSLPAMPSLRTLILHNPYFQDVVWVEEPFPILRTFVWTAFEHSIDLQDSLPILANAMPALKTLVFSLNFAFMAVNLPLFCNALPSAPRTLTIRYPNDNSEPEYLEAGASWCLENGVERVRVMYSREEKKYDYGYSRFLEVNDNDPFDAEDYFS
ncbi:hypothetical protein JCM8097_006115 [Rhodosporidiobolus ruineniae]